MKIECLTQSIAELGECALWHPLHKKIYWIDIVKGLIHCLNPITKDYQSFVLRKEIGCIALANNGDFIAALKNGIAKIQLNPLQINMIHTLFNDNDAQMFNDGKCDRQGRFWAGTKDKQEKHPIASLYCLSKHHQLKKILTQLTVENGPAFTADGKIMYVCDSPLRMIYQYEVDIETGQLFNKKIFTELEKKCGFPDGLTVDADNYIWNAHWDGWQITRYDPNGKIDLEIKLPVPRPTSICFGGEDLKTLFITSAKINLTQAILNQAPLSGALFSIQTPYQGIAEPVFKD